MPIQRWWEEYRVGLLAGGVSASETLSSTRKAAILLAGEGVKVHCTAIRRLEAARRTLAQQAPSHALGEAP
jgi:hypothetical protein